MAKVTPGGFSEPRCLGIAIQGKPGGSVFPSVAANGNLYFASRKGSLGRRDIFRARREGEGFATPENLGGPINTAEDEFDAAISPGEDTLVFSRGRATAGCDLHISRWEGGTWGEPRKLGPEVNSGHGSYCPAWSPDGCWFYFTSGGGEGRAPGIYRIEAGAVGAGFGKGGTATKAVGGAKTVPFLSRPGAFGITFTPDGRTACFAEARSRIVESSLVDGAWSRPQPLPFTLDHFNFAPAVAPDGSTLYFVSNRPSPGHPLRSETDATIWAVSRAGSGWGEPRRLGNLVDEGKDCYVDSLSAAADGTLVFTAILGGGPRNTQVYLARPSAQGFVSQGLSPALGGAGEDLSDVGVAPGGDAIVFSSNRAGGLGGHDLYLSRRNADGIWSTPVNLGPEFNSPGSEASPVISADGQTLYFYSDRDGKPGIYKAPLP